MTETKPNSASGNATAKPGDMPAANATTAPVPTEVQEEVANLKELEVR